MLSNINIYDIQIHQVGQFSLKEVDTVTHLAICVFLSSRNTEIGMLLINVCDIQIHQYIYIYSNNAQCQHCKSVCALNPWLSSLKMRSFRPKQRGQFGHTDIYQLYIVIYI